MSYTLDLNVAVLRVMSHPEFYSRVIGRIQRVHYPTVTASIQEGDWFFVDAMGGWVQRIWVSRTRRYHFDVIRRYNDGSDNYTETKRPQLNLEGSVLEFSSLPRNGIVEGKPHLSYSEITDNDIASLLDEGEIREGYDSSNDILTYGYYSQNSQRYYASSSRSSDWAYVSGQAKTTKLSATMSENITRMRHNLSITTPQNAQNLFIQFNRWKRPMTDIAIGKTIPYVFFTRPSLPISQVVGASGNVGGIDGLTPGDITLAYPFNTDPVLAGINATNPWIMRMLVNDGFDKHKFNSYLSNSARSFEIQDEVVSTIKHGRTYSGWEMVYGRNTNQSNTSGQFNIQYMDDNNANILKIHKMWLYVINALNRGIYKPSRAHIFEKIVNYVCAVYYFELHTDGETILYWAKYYGVFPMNVPGNSHGFSWATPTALQDFSVSYVYSLRKEMDAVSLSEFNSLSTGRFLYRKSYDGRIRGATPTMVNAPFIEQGQNHGKKFFKLRFRN